MICSIVWRVTLCSNSAFECLNYDGINVTRFRCDQIYLKSKLVSKICKGPVKNLPKARLFSCCVDQLSCSKDIVWSFTLNFLIYVIFLMYIRGSLCVSQAVHFYCNHLLILMIHLESCRIPKKERFIYIFYRWLLL